MLGNHIHYQGIKHITKDQTIVFIQIEAFTIHIPCDNSQHVSPWTFRNTLNNSNNQINSIHVQSPNYSDILGCLQSQILGLQTQTLQHSTLNSIKIFNGNNKSEFTSWAQSVDNAAKLCNLDTLSIVLSKLQGPPLKSACFLESKKVNVGKQLSWHSLKKHLTNKNLPNILCHPQLHLEIPRIWFACIAIDKIGKLPTTSSGNKYALTCIEMLTLYIIAVPMPDKNCHFSCWSISTGILSRAEASMVCLLDNGSELKNNQMNTILKHLGIKHIYSNPYRPQGNSRIENVHNFLKRTLTKFLSSLDTKWDKVLPFACYCFNSTPTPDDLESPFFLIHGREPLEGCIGLLGLSDTRYMGKKKVWYSLPN